MLRWLHKLLIISGLLLAAEASVSAREPTFSGTVVRVKDGDSVVIWRPDVKRRSEIRLAGIDAPELAQPWGIQSRSALRRMVDGRHVDVEVTDKDVYGRLVARLYMGKRYVNAEMVREGQAHAFDRYLKDTKIRKSQDEAMKAQRGLWKLPPQDRLPPATWRTRHPYTGESQ